MCFGSSSSKSDGKSMSVNSGDNNTAHEEMMKSAADKPKDTLISRPKPRSNNAYTSSGAKHKQAGKRFNPSLLQRVLDKSPTYNLVSYIGRRFDPRG